ncbi:MAG TPA: dihydrodipicolinate synthase family protein, partial [Betaproteobacteria bacterium]|nr:dihydrodipicolinate synthase family protein [Betaproteobacteria bacterium]
MKFSGVIPILVTPFNEDESVDTKSIQTMIHLMKDIGVNGVTILGVLGEANRLTDNER